MKIHTELVIILLIFIFETVIAKDTDICNCLIPHFNNPQLLNIDLYQNNTISRVCNCSFNNVWFFQHFALRLEVLSSEKNSEPEEFAETLTCYSKSYSHSKKLVLGENYCDVGELAQINIKTTTNTEHLQIIGSSRYRVSTQYIIVFFVIISVVLFVFYRLFTKFCKRKRHNFDYVSI
eukprot:TRINITY_DN1949_c0_g1_i1.p1 TRINITY_DN1949_c0_g1~~TRINITY_DN1949_c0_g1_i1.p1  ORF type:complete len:178 (-),score=31.21 TRINITY_DN1949_c0_g1_i1:25-558(-)